MGRRGLGSVVGLAALVALAPRPSRACAVVSAADAVGITREQAIVVWDPATKKERFIRRAQFETRAKDFGFLVPTPSKPELEEASDGAFAALDQVIEDAREQVIETEWSAGCATLMIFARSKGMAMPASAVAGAEVTVLGTQTVAGLDATILEASSAAALSTWLSAHGYVQRPQITAWLEPYVAAHYKITAFKYASGEDRPIGEILSKSVMLTFDTDRPFYPYREPVDTEPRWGRLLRVFVLAPGRMDGRLGDAAWSVDRIFAMPLAGHDGKLTGDLPARLLPPGAWLTVMNDHATKREGGLDVVFAPSADAAPVKPPPRVTTRHVFIPLEVVVFVGTVAVLVVRARRNKKRARRKGRGLTPPDASPPSDA